jgi:hypothetical protein
MNKQIKMLIDFLEGSDKECCELDVLESPEEWIIPLLGKKAAIYFRIYFRNKAGDLVGEWDIDGKFDDEKPLPFVWLSSEGSPRTVIAKDARAFLSLLPYGENILSGIPELTKAYNRTPGKMISPEKKFNKEALEKSYLYQATRFEGHESMVLFITKTLGIELSSNPLEEISNALNSFPDLDEWLEKNLDNEKD